ncbi:hypothetical protein [Hymenobacter sp. IS2118]|uniref:hypothetical protein n=1 Tax=Hymenobacter sp. IS2118 TaxID=1505605 RepID=UPI000555ADB3|nr:hypothetical protein [Hymenobacter sp. IS2118]
MRNFVISSTFFFLISGSLPVQAQMADRLADRPTFSTASIAKAADQDALAITREMSNRLHLNEGQFISLLALNRTKQLNLKTLAREYRSNEAAGATRVAELEAQFEREFSRILTPSQLSQLQHEPNQQPAPSEPGHGLG